MENRQESLTLLHAFLEVNYKGWTALTFGEPLGLKSKIVCQHNDLVVREFCDAAAIEIIGLGPNEHQCLDDVVRTSTTTYDKAIRPYLIY